MIIRRLTIIAFFLLNLSACGVDLFCDRLSIAVLDEEYSEFLGADDNDWSLWGNEDMVFDFVGGDLPDGLSISSDGEITGIPTEVGIFEFEVRAYALDYGWGSWDSENDDVDYDDEWFTLLVTEASTNGNCPAPDDETTTETYLCVGTPSATTVALDEAVAMDINWFFGFGNARDYNIDTVDFTITYDTTYWSIDTNELNSQILREAVTEAEQESSFDGSTVGQIRVILTAGEDEEFSASGRVMDLNFYAIQNIPAGEYPITITLNSIVSGSDDVSLPTTIEIDGSITVEETIAEEAEADVSETIQTE